MRLTDNTKFPHPVLGPFTGDYKEGEFSVEFDVTESRVTGALSLSYEIILTEPNLSELVNCGVATVGCIIRCAHTFYSDVRTLSYKVGLTEFSSGLLLNSVTLRPVIWLNKDIPEWNPSSLHPEFSSPISLKAGNILAVAAETEISVGQEKLVPIESIFELSKSADVSESEMRVDLESDRISIFLSPVAFELIDLLRQKSSTLSVVMSAIYLPAVMEVLDRLREEGESYEGRRWYTPFTQKCISKNISIDSSMSILEEAQKLLEYPILSLRSCTEDK